MTNHMFLQQQPQMDKTSFIRKGSSSTAYHAALGTDSSTISSASSSITTTNANTKTHHNGQKGRERLRTSIIREAMLNDAKDWNIQKNGPIIHIILTRFQQHQGILTNLGSARLKLFETFCLPTIIRQTNQNFLWIIRTDPKLDNDIKNKMKQLLQPYENYLLVESNKRRNETKRFGNIQEFGDIIDYDHIISGNKLLAAQYLKAASSSSTNQIPIIETRLDADDGLHKEFIDIIQTSAKQRFFTTTTLSNNSTTTATVVDKNNSIAADGEDKKKGKKNKKKSKNNTEEQQQQQQQQLVLKKDAFNSWVYWCADHHFEWHYSSIDSTNERRGDLNYTREPYCITPGMTLGYGSNVELINVPKNQHWKLHRQVGPCYTSEDTNCIMHMANIRPAAIRARTPTSAGMKNVGSSSTTTLLDDANDDEEAKEKRHYLKNLQWKVLEQTMNITEDMSTKTNLYLQQHLVEIAIDNLKGQCSIGHSCKRQAKDKLQSLIINGTTTTITTSIDDESKSFSR